MKPKIALALGGGGARGCAHIGVLKVLQQENIPFDFVTGASIGAVVGSLYAVSGEVSAIETRFRQFIENDVYKKCGLELFKRKAPAENLFAQVATTLKQRVVINLAQSKSSLVGGQRLKLAMDFLIPEGRIEQTKVPFYPVASNIANGQQVIFKDGDLRTIVAASACIPGFLPPCRVNGYLLVDGSVVCPIPIMPARELGADIVIAIDVGQELNDHPQLDNVINVMFQTQHMTARHYNLLLLEQADVVIRPEVGNVHWSEFNLLDSMIAAGEQATRAALPQIRRALRTRLQPWRRLFG